MTFEVDDRAEQECISIAYSINQHGVNIDVLWRLRRLAALIEGDLS